MSTLDRTGAEIARGIHDMGGLPADMVRPTEHDYEPWEKRVDALLVLLSHKSRSLLTVDELRRNIEAIGPGAYDRLAYYERWMHAITQTLVQRGVLTIEQLSHRMADVEARNARGEL